MYGSDQAVASLALLSNDVVRPLPLLYGVGDGCVAVCPDAALGRVGVRGLIGCSECPHEASPQAHDFSRGFGQWLIRWLITIQKHAGVDGIDQRCGQDLMQDIRRITRQIEVHLSLLLMRESKATHRLAVQHIRSLSNRKP